MKLFPCHANPVMLLLLALALNMTVILGYSLEHNQENETDRVALLAIKSQLIDDSSGVLRSWNHSQHHCDWEGVICGHKHQRVTMLDLHSRSLSGTISPFLGNLSFLRYLLLHNNKLHGQIPNEIGRLSRLSMLLLTNNTLIGEIPANLSGCRSLQTLDLGVNKLEGRLPLTLGALTNLRVLEVSKNNFTGPLFKVIANLTSLEGIFAYYNAFTGNIPESSIASMMNLQILGLGNNEFTEYGLGGQASPAGDIYSFGILLLELMTGKRPTGNIFGADFNLHKYAKAALPDQVLHIVDPALTKQDSEETDEKGLTQTAIQHTVECMVAVIRVGVACSNDSPRDRMGIKDALNELQRARNIISSSKHIHETKGGKENYASFP